VNASFQETFGIDGAVAHGMEIGDLVARYLVVKEGRTDSDVEASDAGGRFRMSPAGCGPLAVIALVLVLMCVMTANPTPE
jgi:hypothetical protein